MPDEVKSQACLVRSLLRLGDPTLHQAGSLHTPCNGGTTVCLAWLVPRARAGSKGTRGTTALFLLCVLCLRSHCVCLVQILNVLGALLWLMPDSLTCSSQLLWVHAEHPRRVWVRCLVVYHQLHAVVLMFSVAESLLCCWAWKACPQGLVRLLFLGKNTFFGLILQDSCEVCAGTCSHPVLSDTRLMHSSAGLPQTQIELNSPFRMHPLIIEFICLFVLFI